MARYAYDLYCNDAKFIDLQKINFPMCDGDECYENPIVGELKKSILSAKSVLFALSAEESACVREVYVMPAK